MLAKTAIFGLGASAALILLAASPAKAHDEDMFAPVPAGGLSWDMLVATEAIEWTDESRGTKHLRPSYAPEMLAQRGRKVIVAGYMMATTDAAEQDHFLLFASPPDCLFHMTVGPSRFIEVRTPKPVRYRAGAVAITGHLELIDQPKGGVFYRISDGEAVTAR